MSVKISLIAILMFLTSFVKVQCSPIDMLSQLTDSNERKLLLRFAEYLSNDYGDDSDDSDDSSSYSNGNGIKTRGVSARQEKCRLPMRRGLCRALLPRWR